MIGASTNDAGCSTGLGNRERFRFTGDATFRSDEAGIGERWIDRFVDDAQPTSNPGCFEWPYESSYRCPIRTRETQWR